MNTEHKFNCPSDEVGSYIPDMAGELDSPEDILCEEYTSLSHQDAAKLVKHITSLKRDDLPSFIAWALDDKNPTFKLWAAAFASGMEITEGVSMAEKAKHLGVTRAAFSKRVKQLEKEYGFRSRNMKSLAGCKAYSRDKKTNHWRYQKTLENAKNEFDQELLD